MARKTSPLETTWRSQEHASHKRDPLRVVDPVFVAGSLKCHSCRCLANCGIVAIIYIPAPSLRGHLAESHCTTYGSPDRAPRRSRSVLLKVGFLRHCNPPPHHPTQPGHSACHVAPQLRIHPGRVSRRVIQPSRGPALRHPSSGATGLGFHSDEALTGLSSGSVLNRHLGINPPFR